MYNLLLVDDERIVLDGMFNNVAWEDSGFHNVYRTQSAKAALQIMQQYRIDVVVTDISMPDMDGIALCQAVREAWPLCRVIFLSGYQSFDYARRAVELGVYQYLVKPIRYEDLQQTVEGALAELIQELQQAQQLQDAQAKTEAMSKLLFEQLLYRWLVQNELSKQEFSEELKTYGVHLSDDNFGFPMLLDAGRTDRDAQNMVALQSLAERVFSGSDAMFVQPVRRGQLAIVYVASGRKNVELLRRRIEGRLDTFQQAAEIGLMRKVSIALGAVSSICAMPDAYKAMRSTMHRARLLDEGHIVVTTGSEPDLPVPGDALMEALAAMDKSALFNWVDKAADRALKSAPELNLARLMTMELMGALTCDAVSRSLPISELERVASPLFSPNALEVGVDRLPEILKQSIQGYAQLIESRQQSRRKETVDAVRNIISQRMAEGLNVNAIASQLHYNPSYLSQLIKQETGQTLGDLMLSMRMD